MVMKARMEEYQAIVSDKARISKRRVLFSLRLKCTDHMLRPCARTIESRLRMVVEVVFPRQNSLADIRTAMCPISQPRERLVVQDLNGGCCSYL